MPGPMKAVPEGFHTLTPHITVRDADRAIKFYQNAFGAELIGQINRAPDGKILHACLKIGDSNLMLNDEFPQFGRLSPLSANASGVTLHLYLENIDSAFDRAVSAGATVKMPLKDQFWGDRYGQVMDPFGHQWSLAAHVRDVPEVELRKEETESLSKMPQSA
jgi:PhnB protein